MVFQDAAALRGGSYLQFRVSFSACSGIMPSCLRTDAYQAEMLFDRNCSGCRSSRRTLMILSCTKENLTQHHRAILGQSSFGGIASLAWLCLGFPQHALNDSDLWRCLEILSLSLHLSTLSDVSDVHQERLIEEMGTTASNVTKSVIMPATTQYNQYIFASLERYMSHFLQPTAFQMFSQNECHLFMYLFI